MSKREKFLEACRKQKLDTVRWSLGAGGKTPTLTLNPHPCDASPRLETLYTRYPGPWARTVNLEP
jgi:hypothetical protein